ncbi:MAG TPA: hypothetical protein VIQ76_11460 [Propionibacteriaceae bacterium]|jgi:Acyl dehydratase
MVERRASGASPTGFHDIRVGDSLPSLQKGPMTALHLMRWSAAVENWHRIHYDTEFAVGHDGLPERLVNGSWKQQVLVQLVKDWVGDTGWLWKISLQFRGMDVIGDTLTAWGTVTELRQADDVGLAECEIGLRNQRGEETTPGRAIAVFPLAAGDAVGYPFVPPREH